MNNAEQLAAFIKVRKLIKRGWIKDISAINWLGNPCFPTDFFARKFCLFGACERVVKGDNVKRKVITDFLNMSIYEQYGVDFGVVAFNDHMYVTKENVLNLLNMVIDKQKKLLSETSNKAL